MFKLLKLWLERCKLKYPSEVQFDKEGKVIDCKGLQLVSGEPYSEEAVYKISDRWKGYDYLGNSAQVSEGFLFQEMLSILLRLKP